MKQYDYETQAQKYEFISGQHGGYYRHDFVDHAYLYNLYFPPEAVFTNFKHQIHDLVLNYPVAQDALAGLIGELIHQPAERIVSNVSNFKWGRNFEFQMGSDQAKIFNKLIIK
jgi:threonine-phosphate decarboxylase